MCGIVGIYSHDSVAAELYDSLIHLQHRGQDASGILTCDDRFYAKHGLGLVREAISTTDLAQLKGKVGIAHARYPTAGGYSEADVQPLWIGSPRGIALAHNGNLVNYQELVDDICGKQHRHLNSTLDSEALLLLLADSLAVGSYSDNDEAQFFELLCSAVNTIYSRVEGSFSVVSLVIGKGLVAFRDPHGIRPLVWGERVRDDGRKDYIFASETTPFYSLGFEPKGDLLPGEVVYVNAQGQLFKKVITQKAFTPCLFEYVYFARPDATLDDVSVYRARLRMGQNLAKRWKEKYPETIPDVVIPAPSTANTAALAFANELGIRYSEGLYKNPFIGRTFIMPNQESRSRQVRYKLTPQKTEINKKRVLIVDDSIVRGTTSREIVHMIREFGALEIYFVSTCPPIKNPCFYGIDIPSRKKLIAAHKSEEEIRQFLGVDKLLYQTQTDLVEAVSRKGKYDLSKPCMACMDGIYVCGQINESKIRALEKKRLQENGIDTEIGEMS
ncbi:amidophosphoribosyltransferase [Legionella waltersii]|uniref:Amidophosphoribosyltransferase n=1 Tax=Legionella waltersii TaxID=66969 RepID=A0A0W1A198_9GAMM|nr:amidophosphoribosyltransferase [Legionella waltersii]KTD75157.1 amidophosphoribosyltransferase [Legionella waltersii]SNV04766.1 amidophosphoribosyltransferase [Legionella waltersii]